MTGRTVKEWVGATPDAAIPPRVRLRIFERRADACHVCGRKLFPGDRWDLDHVVALTNGGAHAEGNLAPICEWCHRGKTAEDVALKSRVYHKRAAHLGIRKTKSPIRGWRRFNGEPVRNPRVAR